MTQNSTRSATSRRSYASGRRRSNPLALRLQSACARQEQNTRAACAALPADKFLITGAPLVLPFSLRGFDRQSFRVSPCLRDILPASPEEDDFHSIRSLKR